MVLWLIVHPYTTYPLSLWMLSLVHRLPPPPPREDQLPKISVLIAAYNEEAMIERTVQAILHSRYPQDRLEILIGSDASTDRTAEILSRLAQQFPIIKPLFFTTRQGKPAVLNQLVQQSNGNILVFMDADTFLHPDTLKTLVQHLQHPHLACVDATIAISEPHHIEQRYYNFDHWLKTLESRIGVIPSLHGLCYAIKREVFTPFPTDILIADDIYRALDILAQGHRIGHASAAYATELAPRNLYAEFQRRIRYAIGGLQVLRIIRQRRGKLPILGWYTLFSRKMLRWFGFPILMGFATLSFILSTLSPVYTYAAIATSVAGLMTFVGAAGFLLASWRIPIAYHLFYYITMLIALFLGTLQFFTKRSPFWKPPRRH